MQGEALGAEWKMLQEECARCPKRSVHESGNIKSSVQNAPRGVCKGKLSEQCAKCFKRSLQEEALRAVCKMPQEECAR